MTSIVISGGGVAGASAACALSSLLEKHELSGITVIEKDSRDLVGGVKRGEVIRPEVTRILERIGVLDYVKKNNPVVRPNPEQEIWHSQAGKLGSIDYGLLAKGYPMMYLPHALIVKSLYDKLEKTRVEIHYGAETTGVERTNGKLRVSFKENTGIEQKDTVEADLLIVAEGGSSNLRGKLKLDIDFFDYNMGYLMVFLSKPEEIQWGRHCLSPEGFVGLFSMPDEKMRAAVEVRSADLKDWLTLGRSKIVERIQKRIPYLGKIQVVDVGSFYHVIKRHAKTYSLDNILLIGDSAHTTHPMLGQGMSMVFHDVEVLYDFLSTNPEGPFDTENLSSYDHAARPFNETVLQNNHDVFNAFSRMGEQPDRINEFMPTLEKVGFKKK